MKSSRQALLALHGAVALFGCAGLIGKVVASPALVVTCVRSLVGALALGLGLLVWHGGRSREARRQPALPRRGLWLGLLAAGALLAAHWWAFFAAVRLGTVALGLLTFASYPLFATLLEPVIFRERLRVADLAACAGVGAGLALVVPEWNFGTRAGRAAVVGLASGLTFALLSLLNRRLVRDAPALALVAAETTVAGLVLLPLAAPGLVTLPGRDWAWLLVLGVVFTGLAHWAFTAALSRVPVRLAGVTAALEPVYGVALAWLLLGENPGARTLAGGCLIVGATLLATLARDWGPASLNQPGA